LARPMILGPHFHPQVESRSEDVWLYVFEM
jgi:hypothetical protein